MNLSVFKTGDQKKYYGSFQAALKKIYDESGAESVNQFAHLIGMPQPLVRDYLNGTRSPSYQNLLHFINAVDVPVEFWFNGGEM